MSKDWLWHHSHLLLYRSPFGAASCNAAVELAIAVRQDHPVDAVYLRTWHDGQGEELLPMVAAERDTADTSLYRVTFNVPDKPGIVWYYFIIYAGGAIHYYGNNSEEKGGCGAIYETPPPSYQLTVYQPAAKTPDWFKNAVVYQIFVDRFFNGNASGKINAAKKGSMIHPYWDDDPVYVRERETGRILAYDFFGGNLAGVIAKLPYLKDLGISAIYFNPIFEACSNHKYDTADYKTIDPMFGSNSLFEELCSKARDLGMAVILDGVFSHTGSDSIYFNREEHYPEVGAWQSKESPYYSWYRFTEYPDEYESWWGVDALPNVDEMEPSYRDFIIHGKESVLRHWLKLGAKGWRLDVADELPDEFIRQFRQVMKEIDSDSVLIGEVWEDASHKVSYSELRGYFHGDELDSATNYPFRQAALGFLMGWLDADATRATLLSLCENYPPENFYATLNMLSSHDVPRILTLLGGHESLPDLPDSQQLKRRLSPDERQLALARLRLLALWQMTSPGVPHIYYGDEAGLEGYTDPLNRRTFPWGREEVTLAAWYKKLIGLRKDHAVLRTGTWQPFAVHPDVYSYVRLTPDGRDVFGQPQTENCAIVFLNRSQREITVECDLSCWCQGLLFDVLDDDHEVAVGDGQASITLKPLEGRLLLTRLSGENLKCGILLHPTALPGGDGIGSLGKEAYSFVDFLAQARQNYWQILPLNPVGFGYSPYQSVSAFASETLLIDIDLLVAAKLLEPEEVADARKEYGLLSLAAAKADYEVVKKYKEHLFRLAFRRFAVVKPEKEYIEFLAANTFWLPDYALYMALTDHFATAAWNDWPADIAGRQASALTYYGDLLVEEISYHVFLQYIFRGQWTVLREYAVGKGIKIIGDMPIFVAHHSADVWAHSQLFQLDRQGRPTVVAGVPPDYFSETGQLWGNPLYRWQEMAKDDYCWWRERFTVLLSLVDMVRVDHFRGFEGYWQIPASAETAEKGRWVKGPGKRFFAVLKRYFGQLPVIAEDLGVITPEVTALRRQFDYPGMKVLHFAFNMASSGQPEPLECGPDTVVYTGTHDNDTTLGWYRELALAGGTAAVDRYLGLKTGDDDREVPWRLTALAYNCQAGTAIIPLQDVLGLGPAARMNTPGTVGGNWEWRCADGRLTADLAEKLAVLAAKYHRGK